MIEFENEISISGDSPEGGGTPSPEVKTPNFTFNTGKDEPIPIEDVYDEETGVINFTYGPDGYNSFGLEMKIVIPEGININPSGNWQFGNGQNLFHITDANGQNLTHNKEVIGIYTDIADSENPTRCGHLWWGSNAYRGTDGKPAYFGGQFEPLVLQQQNNNISYIAPFLSRVYNWNTRVFDNGSSIRNNDVPKSNATRLSMVILYFNGVFESDSGDDPTITSNLLGDYFSNSLDRQVLKSFYIYSDEYPDGVDIMWDKN